MVLLLFGGALATACSTEVTVRGGCDSDADCPDNHRCVSMLCVPGGGQGGSTATSTGVVSTTGTVLPSTTTSHSVATSVSSSSSTGVTVTTVTTGPSSSSSGGGGTCDKGDCISCFFSGCAAAKCLSQFQACINEPDCQKLYTCLDQCEPNDGPCYDKCIQTATPNSAFLGLYECVMCNSNVCGNDCQGSC